MVIELAADPHFPSPLIGQFLGDGSRLIVTAPLVFIDGDTTIVVPGGFETDFNSVPRPLWTWFPPWQFPEAGVIHDWLYQHPNGRTREQCDAIHRRILQLRGCRKSKRVAAYLGLRAGGWKPWNRYRAEEEAS